MRDEDIDVSDIPGPKREFLAHAILWPGTTQQVMLRLDPDGDEILPRSESAEIRPRSLPFSENTWKRWARR